jgi:hypothetical protein
MCSMCDACGMWSASSHAPATPRPCRVAQVARHLTRRHLRPILQNRELVEIVRALQAEREGLLGELGDALQVRCYREGLGCHCLCVNCPFLLKARSCEFDLQGDAAHFIYATNFFAANADDGE